MVENDKLANPEYPYKIQVIMDAIERNYNKKATGSECGMIYQKAGDVGHAVVAVNKSATWGEVGTAEYYNYMPKIRRELSTRDRWPDNFHNQAKIENRKFDEWMSQKFVSPISEILSKIGNIGRKM